MSFSRYPHPAPTPLSPGDEETRKFHRIYHNEGIFCYKRVPGSFSPPDEYENSPPVAYEFSKIDNDYFKQLKRALRLQTVNFLKTLKCAGFITFNVVINTFVLFENLSDPNAYNLPQKYLPYVGWPLALIFGGATINANYITKVSKIFEVEDAIEERLLSEEHGDEKLQLYQHIRRCLERHLRDKKVEHHRLLGETINKLAELRKVFEKHESNNPRLSNEALLSKREEYKNLAKLLKKLKSTHLYESTLQCFVEIPKDKFDLVNSENFRLAMAFLAHEAHPFTIIHDSNDAHLLPYLDCNDRNHRPVGVEASATNQTFISSSSGGQSSSEGVQSGQPSADGTPPAEGDNPAANAHGHTLTFSRVLIKCYDDNTDEHTEGNAAAPGEHCGGMRHVTNPAYRDGQRGDEEEGAQADPGDEAEQPESFFTKIEPPFDQQKPSWSRYFGVIFAGYVPVFQIILKGLESTFTMEGIGTLTWNMLRWGSWFHFVPLTILALGLTGSKSSINFSLKTERAVAEIKFTLALLKQSYADGKLVGVYTVPLLRALWQQFFTLVYYFFDGFRFSPAIFIDNVLNKITVTPFWGGGPINPLAGIPIGGNARIAWFIFALIFGLGQVLMAQYTQNASSIKKAEKDYFTDLLEEADKLLKRLKQHLPEGLETPPGEEPASPDPDGGVRVADGSPLGLALDDSSGDRNGSHPSPTRLGRAMTAEAQHPHAQQQFMQQQHLSPAALATLRGSDHTNPLRAARPSQEVSPPPSARDRLNSSLALTEAEHKDTQQKNLFDTSCIYTDSFVSSNNTVFSVYNSLKEMGVPPLGAFIAGVISGAGFLWTFIHFNKDLQGEEKDFITEFSKYLSCLRSNASSAFWSALSLGLCTYEHKEFKLVNAHDIADDDEEAARDRISMTSVADAETDYVKLKGTVTTAWSCNFFQRACTAIGSCFTDACLPPDAEAIEREWREHERGHSRGGSVDSAGSAAGPGTQMAPP